MVKSRRLVKLRAAITILSTSVIVFIFVFLHNEITKDTIQVDVPSQMVDVHRTHRLLLRFKYRRKKLQDKMWLTESLNKTNMKFSNKPELNIDTSESLLMKIKNKLWYKYTAKSVVTVSDTTPAVTAAPTRPITTQSDTTPASTNTPTKPITTESITTPLYTEAGQKEMTTEKTEDT